MFMNQHEIEWAATQQHDCPNVRKGVRLLLALMQAVNAQSDGWHSWPAPSKSAEKLQELLKTAGNLNYGTHGKISAEDLKKAIAPIRAMVTHQKKKQAQYGNKFDFDVDAALLEENPSVKVCVEIAVDTRMIANRFGIDTADKAVQHWIENETSWPEFVQNISVKEKLVPIRRRS